MEIIFVENFKTTNTLSLDSTMSTMYNISMHCHTTPSDEIWIYSESYKFYLVGYDNKVTYPKVTYVSRLEIKPHVSLSKILPGLKKIGNFLTDWVDIDDFGKILEIDRFPGMSIFLDPKAREKYNIVTNCKPLNGDMFRFTSKKGSWNIKINDYN